MMQTGKEWTFREFVSIEELSEWLNENSILLGDLQIGIPIKQCFDCRSDTTITTTMSSTLPTSELLTPTTILTSECDMGVSHPDIEVKSLSDQPLIRITPLSESTGDNVWYVDDYESLKDACSTSKVTYNGNTLLMNVCEANGKTTVNLILEIAGKISHVPFRLEKSCNRSGDHDMILSI